MGTHFIGEKKLKKFSNKYNVNFVRGYNLHADGENSYILNDESENIFILTITKDKNYILGIVNNLRKNISYCYPEIKVKTDSGVFII